MGAVDKGIDERCAVNSMCDTWLRTKPQIACLQLSIICRRKVNPIECY